MPALLLLLALAAPLSAEGPAASYSAALNLGDDGLLRVVETLRPVGEFGSLCGPVERELPAKRLRLDGLRRLVAVRVKAVFRGAGAGLTPAAWTLRLLPALLLAAVHAVFTGSVRYRAPALPGLCILAAAALAPRREP